MGKLKWYKDAGKTASAGRAHLSHQAVVDDDFSRAADQLRYVPLGAPVAVADGLRDIYSSLRAPYGQNVRWIISSTAASELDKLRTGPEGDYLWRERISEVASPRLVSALRPHKTDTL